MERDSSADICLRKRQRFPEFTPHVGFDIHEAGKQLGIPLQQMHHDIAAKGLT